MKDRVEIGHSTNYDTFRVNRDQVMDLEIWLEIHTNVSTGSPSSKYVVYATLACVYRELYGKISDRKKIRIV